MTQSRILVVDDEHDILELIEYNLKNEGYEVILADNGSEGIELAEKHRPDLILLDIMMPDMNGHQVCSHLKSNSVLKHIPVVFLTARDDEMTEIRSLNEGADDYLTKPITISRLLSHIKAVLRRSASSENETTGPIRLRDLEIDRERYVVVKQGEDIRLPKKEFEVLHYLAANPGKVISRQALLNKIWGDDIYVIDRTVDVHIRKIREKLGNQYIETVKGVGYRCPA